MKLKKKTRKMGKTMGMWTMCYTTLPGYIPLISYGFEKKFHTSEDFCVTVGFTILNDQF